MRIDATLLRRLESTAATAEVNTVAAMCARDAACTAAAAPFGNGALIAMGTGRFVNRAIGITLDELGPSELDAIEHFYGERGLVPALELSSWAPATTIDALGDRGFRLQWFRAMFVYDLTDQSQRRDPPCRIEPLSDTTVESWLDTLATANGIEAAERRAVSDEYALAIRAAPSATTLVAVDGTTVVGCGTAHVVDDVAWLGGAATRPDWQGRGVQASLLDARLRFAAGQGCRLAAATAVPTGGSARNLVATGFLHVQTQTVVARPLT